MRSWWRLALFVLAAPPLAFALAALVRGVPIALLLALPVLVALPVAVALLGSMARRGGRFATAAVLALGIDVVVGIFFASGFLGILAIPVLLGPIAAAALLWAADERLPATLSTAALVWIVGILAAPRLAAESVQPFSAATAIPAAALGGAIAWGALALRSPPEPALDAPRPAPPAPPDRAARAISWLVALGLLLAVATWPFPWAAPALATLAVALLVLPALVALRDTPPPMIALGALALLGLVPIGQCASYADGAVARVSASSFLTGAAQGSCAPWPAITGMAWAFALACAAWTGLALRRPAPRRSR